MSGRARHSQHGPLPARFCGKPHCHDLHLSSGGDIADMAIAIELVAARTNLRGS